MPESQSINQVRNPNLLPGHMEPLLNHCPPAEPSTKNPTLTTYQSPTFSEIVIQIVATIFMISVMALLMWLVYLVTPGINTLSSYTVSSATVDPFNISSSRLTAVWNISIYIKNYRRQREVHYDRVRLTIYYGSHLLSQVSIHPFYVQRLGHMTLHARLMNNSESLDVGVAESMVRDRLLRGAVDFRLELLARAKYLQFFWDWYKFRISCENVTVGFPVMDDMGPGIMLGPPRKCNLFVDEKPKKQQ